MNSNQTLDNNIRYHTALQLLDDCRGIDDGPELYPKINALLKYCRENFPAPEVKSEKIQEDASNIMRHWKRLSSVEYEALLRSIPPKVADSLFPLALMVLGSMQYLPEYNPSKVAEFSWFNKTYGRLVVNAA